VKLYWIEVIAYGIRKIQCFWFNYLY
jgi:hypothetical protein